MLVDTRSRHAVRRPDLFGFRTNKSLVKAYQPTISFSTTNSGHPDSISTIWKSCQVNPKREIQINLIVLGCLLGTILIFNPIKAFGDPVGTQQQPGWMKPVPGPTIRLFERPLGPYLSGHRGIDFPAVTDEPILAPANGRVSFVGLVVDRTVVVVDHGDGIKSEVEPICPSVVVGQLVLKGAPLGIFCSPETPYQFHCLELPCVHFSIRKNGEYYAPEVLVGGLAPSHLKVW